jgi:hypothetical protein
VQDFVPADDRLGSKPAHPGGSDRQRISALSRKRAETERAIRATLSAITRDEARPIAANIANLSELLAASPRESDSGG